MRGILKGFLKILIVGLLWSGFFVFGVLEGWFQSPLATVGDTKAFSEALEAKLEAEFRGNAAYVLLEGGTVKREKFLSVGKPVDENTIFQVASLSKWITAHGVMMLVEDGLLDLDRPVSVYLTRWELPPSDFDNDGVTARRLLSHTAGFADGLGYGGFAQGEPVQSLEASLTHAADASPGRDGRALVQHQPGTKWQYSGASFTLLQLLIEEVSGSSFEDFMASRLFQPLGMSHSSFALETATAPGVADFYDTDGTVGPHYSFTGRAAAGLYTSAVDLVRLLQIYSVGTEGEPVGRGVLTPESLELMRQPEAKDLGLDIWGLGTILYVPTKSGGFIIGHDGNNTPAINTSARLDPETGDGIVLLVTGNELLATELAGDWSFWQTGKPDVFAVQMAMPRLLQILIAGWVVILVLVTGLSLRRRFRR